MLDRSAAYAARYIAKNLVAAGVADECLVQVAYAIGVAQPVSVFVDTYGTAHVSAEGSNGISQERGEATDAYIAAKVKELFYLRPASIVRKFGLTNPIFEATASYGHMGRTPYVKDGIQYFGWELLDAIEPVKKAFGLK